MEQSIQIKLKLNKMSIYFLCDITNSIFTTSQTIQRLTNIPRRGKENPYNKKDHQTPNEEELDALESLKSSFPKALNVSEH